MRGETYEEFVEKFRPKKTTDDCYTPPEIYEVIKDWVCREYGVKQESIVRPFWPGGDYETYNYPAGCVVLDNPPFSILSKICDFYLEKGVKFFLFAPYLTALSSGKTVLKINHIICPCEIEYENGAKVSTSFLTNIRNDDIVAQSEPDLTRLINDKVDELRGQRRKKLPKYEYPNELVTSAKLGFLSKYGVMLKIKKQDCIHVGRLDAQIRDGKAIFGAGLLLAEKAAAEKAAAEKAAAEKYELSDREKELIRNLG